jgi:flagellin-like protein
MIETDPAPERRRRSRRWSERATWELVATLVVLAVILVLAADGAGLISR